ncbi:MAG TPA: nitrilase-related carbon-nitrogen hydrolase [Burkholderiales bacterium]|nr:nitrilase-related carbon-nitrogen hydrolase [Burkholderiales bacterium]
MSSGFRIACLQINSGNDYRSNLATVSAMAREAAGQGAQFILTPEYALMMDGSGRVMRERALAADGAPALGELRALARELGVWFLAGSLTLRTDDDRIANRSFLISAEGRVVASYDKIHMFDVTLPDGRVIRESSTYRPGERAVLAGTPWGRLGMTVCYDLRFPGLFRALAQAGAQFITVPSSFQRQTGKAHWHALLRARAPSKTNVSLLRQRCAAIIRAIARPTAIRWSSTLGAKFLPRAAKRRRSSMPTSIPRAWQR